MTLAGTLLEHRTWTIRSDALDKEPLAPVIVKKTDVQVSFERYFEPCDEGRRPRLAG